MREMRRAHIITLLCLAITAVLAGSFMLNYKEGTLVTGQLAFPTKEAATTAPLNLEAVENANLVGMGVIVFAVIFVTIIVFFRKSAPSDEGI